jgi:hypothetical protein
VVDIVPTHCHPKENIEKRKPKRKHPKEKTGGSDVQFLIRACIKGLAGIHNTASSPQIPSRTNLIRSWFVSSIANRREHSSDAQIVSPPCQLRGPRRPSH